VPVSVIRDFDFPGPVDLAVSGLPSGVSASFSPPQATFPSGVAEQTVTLTLTAPPDGLNRGPATVTVSGSSGGWPSSSATFKVQGACPLPFDARAQSIQIWIVVLELSTKPPGGDGVAGGVERDRRVAHVRAGRGLDRLRGLPVHSARPISAHDRRDWPVVLSCHAVVRSPRWSDAICGPIESCDVLDSTPGKQTPEPRRLGVRRRLDLGMASGCRVDPDEVALPCESSVPADCSTKLRGRRLRQLLWCRPRASGGPVVAVHRRVREPESFWTQPIASSPLPSTAGAVVTDTTLGALRTSGVACQLPPADRYDARIRMSLPFP